MKSTEVMSCIRITLLVEASNHKYVSMEVIFLSLSGLNLDIECSLPPWA